MTNLSWKASWTLARRDLKGGLRGLRLLVICMVLGVGTLAAIGSLTSSLTGELAERGQVLLGGDIELSVPQRMATAQERQAFAGLGTLSETVRMRAMAQRPQVDAPRAAAPAVDGGLAGPAAVLSELKAVDAAYPLYGRLTLEDGRIAPPLSSGGLLIDRALADRLNVAPGGSLRFGSAIFTIAGIIGSEPDRVGEGFTLGPVALTNIAGLERTGLMQPGSLFTAKYRIRMLPSANARSIAGSLAETHRTNGWTVKDRFGAAPSAGRFFERMGQFLSLIGLTALVIAGIGVSNGVASYLAARRNGIATLKILGAQSGDIRRIYLLQIGMIAGAAILLGLLAGALIPPALVAALGDALPVQPGLNIQPVALMTAAAYGLLVALIFTLPPLARAKTQPAAALFRATVDPRWGLDRATIVVVAAAIAAVIALALGTAREPLFSAIVLGAVAAVLLLLLALGYGVRYLAGRVPRPRRPLLRLAVANLHRPGAQTSALVVALGLALTLFVTLAAIQTSLSNEIARTVPLRAPSQFVLDIPASKAALFRQLVGQVAPTATIQTVPALRGTIVAYAGQRVAELDIVPEGAWFLRGDRGITYAATLPDGSELTAGAWWPANYAGPPLVSLDQEAAGILGIGVGDTLVVSVLGREIEARIASLRQINWETMGFNYILVFSPNTLVNAPHTLAATINTEPEREAAISRAVLGALPSVSIIAVGEVLTQVTALLEQMSAAILAAASITILAGIAVLVGAIAASRQSRSYDSVIMKVLGATRWQILAAQAIEYALLATVLALVALALGGAAAWYVITGVFDFNWSPDWLVVGATLAGGALITLGIGLIGSIPLMSARPAEALRAL